MKILITGSGGYIGSNLIRSLSSYKDLKIIGIDISPRPYANKKIKQITADLTATNWIQDFKQPVDVIVHLAQSKRYRDFPAGAEDMFKVNIKSTFELLEWARVKKIKKFIFASSGNVYKSKNGRLRETDECVPTSMYATTKLAAEHLIRQYKDYFDIVIMRLFGVYGPKQKEMVIPKIIEKIKNHEEIALAQSKGFLLTPIYVDDCICAIEKLILAESGQDETIINIAGKDIVSLADIVNQISEILGMPPVTKTNNDKSLLLAADNSKMLSLMGAATLVSFKDGIQKCL